MTDDHRLIITLTTIPPRFGTIAETLRSLKTQTQPVEAINLYLPTKYRRFDYPANSAPDVPDGVGIFFTDVDYGPATKILPAVEQFRSQEVLLLFCDDDKVYDPGWARRFVHAAQQHPDCCIAEEGGDIHHYTPYQYCGSLEPRGQRRRKDLAYRLRRLLSLGHWKPRKAARSGYVDVLEGWGGVLVRPHFFTESVFDIPDILWTVDDIWLSGHLALNRIPIWLNADNGIRTQGNSNEVKSASLRKLVYQGHDRNLANQRCVDYFRDTYGIWR